MRTRKSSSAPPPNRARRTLIVVPSSAARRAPGSKRAQTRALALAAADHVVLCLPEDKPPRRGGPRPASAGNNAYAFLPAPREDFTNRLRTVITAASPSLELIGFFGLETVLRHLADTRQFAPARNFFAVLDRGDAAFLRGEGGTGSLPFLQGGRNPLACCDAVFCEDAGDEEFLRRFFHAKTLRLEHLSTTLAGLTPGSGRGTVKPGAGTSPGRRPASKRVLLLAPLPLSSRAAGRRAVAALAAEQEVIYLPGRHRGSAGGAGAPARGMPNIYSFPPVTPGEFPGRIKEAITAADPDAIGFLGLEALRRYLIDTRLFAPAKNYFAVLDAGDARVLRGERPAPGPAGPGSWKATGTCCPAVTRFSARLPATGNSCAGSFMRTRSRSGGLRARWRRSVPASPAGPESSASSPLRPCVPTLPCGELSANSGSRSPGKADRTWRR